MADLKPCPFCGGEATVKKDNFGNVRVGCTKCPCDIGRSWFTTKREAVRAWNRRANNED